MPKRDLMKEYIESMRPRIDKILNNIKVDFKGTGDTIHIWKAMQWCEALKLPAPSWTNEYVRKQIINGEGIKFDKRSIKGELHARRDFFIAYRFKCYVEEGLSRDLAAAKVREDLENMGLELEDTTIEDIYADRIRKNNKAEKFIKERLAAYEKEDEEFFNNLNLK